ncbi:MAG: single-stranded DNA-binding protein [Prevotella sp.]|nr:single-stranded DNA-binding protein [Prevotella sp.]MDY4150679.1 single-stranded DNA-binding protein [Prevotella sp.]
MNKVMLIGNVGTEPDVHYFEADQAVAKLRLATTERGYTLPNGTQVPDRTDWHNLLFDRRLAKIVEKYVHKGDKLYVEGRLRNRSYDDKRGIRHQYTEIEVENMEFLTPRTSVSSTQSSLSSQQTQTNQQSETDLDNADKLPF